MPQVDPITFAVVREKLISIANGMQETGVRTGVTSFMYEIKDCLFAILDAEAGVIAESHGLFLASLSPAVKNCLAYIGKENIEPGDVIISNIPDITGNHTCDVVVFSPVFFKDHLFGYATTKAHWIDLGAKSSYPTDAANIFEEGLRIPPIKLYKRGNLQKDIWDIIAHNSRAPNLIWGDMQAQIAGCHYAEKPVMELLNKYGIDTINEIITGMYDYSERITRLAIDKIPDGTWTAEEQMDSNGIDLDTPVKVKVAITIKGSDITVDLTGSDPEQRGPLNGLWVTSLSSVRTTVKALTSPELPLNEGFNRPITLIAPKGSIFNANSGVPCFLCGNVSGAIGQLISKALRNVLPEKIPASSGADVIGQGFNGVDPRTGKYWGTLTPCLVGQGADYISDGDSYLLGATQNIPTEILESTYPLLVEKSELIQDSGGAGKYMGGPGSRLQLRLLAPASYYAFIEKGKSPHWGVDGGKPGLRNYALIQSKEKGEFEVLKTSGVPLAKNDRVIVTAGGGGGYGHPLERPIETVRTDVIKGYISVEFARREYGVVIDPPSFEIDNALTKKLRGDMSGRKSTG
jgi:N-methylhydantoinase B